MNVKRFFTMIGVVVLLTGLIALAVATKSVPAAAQVQTHLSRQVNWNEPTVRMWSGMIQFSDSNTPDFRPHAKLFKLHKTPSDCMTEDTFPRRISGCIQ